MHLKRACFYDVATIPPVALTYSLLNKISSFHLLLLFSTIYIRWLWWYYRRSLIEPQSGFYKEQPQKPATGMLPSPGINRLPHLHILWLPRRLCQPALLIVFSTLSTFANFPTNNCLLYINIYKHTLVFIYFHHIYIYL